MERRWHLAGWDSALLGNWPSAVSEGTWPQNSCSLSYHRGWMSLLTLPSSPGHGCVGLFTQYFLLGDADGWSNRAAGCTACSAQHMLRPLPPHRADLPGPTVAGTQSTSTCFAVVLVVTYLWGTPVKVLNVSSVVKLSSFLFLSLCLPCAQTNRCWAHCIILPWTFFFFSGWCFVGWKAA